MENESSDLPYILFQTETEDEQLERALETINKVKNDLKIKIKSLSDRPEIQEIFIADRQALESALIKPLQGFNSKLKESWEVILREDSKIIDLKEKVIQKEMTSEHRKSLEDLDKKRQSFLRIKKSIQNFLSEDQLILLDNAIKEEMHIAN